ncbi:MAG: DUF4097 family beta strand repeat-containing protein [Bacillus sp. (in: Bacteria)]|nr:DUF4097 family beta strand repeat-containing protein [Bacillus sp. (in: firmicutes)]
MGKSKVGRWTAGISLVVIGVVWLFSNWMNISIWNVLPYFWPFVLIGLGAEYMYKQRMREEEDQKVSFDGGAVTLLFIVMLLSGGLFSFQNSGIATGISFFGNNWNTSVDIYEEYDASEMERALLEFTNGSIVVIGEDVEEVTIEGQIRSNHTNERDLLKELDKQKRVKEGETFQYSIKQSTSSFLFANNSLSANLTITVPKHVFVSLVTVNGSVEVKDMASAGEFTTTNGNIRAERISGNLEVRSTNGALSLKEVNGDVAARSTNGKIEVSNVTGEVELRGTNGAIEIKSNVLGGNWEVTTTNGKIDIEFPEGSSAAIEGETTNGSVDGNLVWNRKYDGVRRNRQGDAVVGEGTYKITANGTNGAIRINER